MCFIYYILLLFIMIIIILLAFILTFLTLFTPQNLEIYPRILTLFSYILLDFINYT